MHRAMIQEPSPEKMPLRKTISKVLLSEMFRVQLFSSPQQAAAASTSSEPPEKCRLDISSKERMPLERVMSAMAIQSRREIFSRKRKRAISEVATISKLPRREALAEVALFSPSISRMGAAISSRIMPMV